jgi:hypothetical protein
MAIATIESLKVSLNSNHWYNDAIEPNSGGNARLRYGIFY